MNQGFAPNIKCECQTLSVVQSNKFQIPHFGKKRQVGARLFAFSLYAKNETCGAKYGIDLHFLRVALFEYFSHYTLTTNRGR